MESQRDKTVGGAPLPDLTRVLAARAAIEAAGKTAREWAADHDESPHLVYKVLSGNRACVMGASRRIAIKLGMIYDGEPAAHQHASRGAMEPAR